MALFIRSFIFLGHLFFTFEPPSNNPLKKVSAVLTGLEKPPNTVFSCYINPYFWWPLHFSHIKNSLKESQKGISILLKKTWEAFLNGIFLIHRKSPLLIKVPHKHFFSPSFFEYKVPNHGKENYDHTVNKLGFSLNARSSFMYSSNITYRAIKS